MLKGGGGVCGSIFPWLWRRRVESADEAGRENRFQAICCPMLSDWLKWEKPTRGLVIEVVDFHERFGDWSGGFPREVWWLKWWKSPREVWWLKWWISTRGLVIEVVDFHERFGDWSGGKAHERFGVFLRFPNAAKSWWQLDPLALIHPYFLIADYLFYLINRKVKNCIFAEVASPQQIWVSKLQNLQIAKNIGSGNLKSANCHTCGRSTNVKKSTKFSYFLRLGGRWFMKKIWSKKTLWHRLFKQNISAHKNAQMSLLLRLSL